MLDNGRLLEHFQSMNQSGQTVGTLEQVPEWFVEVGEDTAREMDLEDGSWVRVSSRRGSLEVKVCVTDRVSGHTLFMPIHQGKPGLNLLTGGDLRFHLDGAVIAETVVEVIPGPEDLLAEAYEFMDALTGEPVTNVGVTVVCNDVEEVLNSGDDHGVELPLNLPEGEAKCSLACPLSRAM